MANALKINYKSVKKCKTQKHKNDQNHINYFYIIKRNILEKKR